jgi:hypothetical protein
VLFGPAGTAAPPGLHTGRPEELSGELVKQAVSVLGYEILPAPPP